jgi:hypothetical protein
MVIREAIPLAALTFGLFGAACGPGDPLDDMTVSREEIPHEITTLLDAGNAAFRSGDYETARERYLGAASRDSTVAAAWYGVAMSERALGNDAAADSVLQRLGAIGATLPHHDAADSMPRSPHGSPHGSPQDQPKDSTTG